MGEETNSGSLHFTLTALRVASTDEPLVLSLRSVEARPSNKKKKRGKTSRNKAPARAPARVPPGGGKKPTRLARFKRGVRDGRREQWLKQVLSARQGAGSPTGDAEADAATMDDDPLLASAPAAVETDAHATFESLAESDAIDVRLGAAASARLREAVAALPSISAIDFAGAPVAEQLRRIIAEAGERAGDGFFLCNVAVAAEQLERWREALPDVEPHYAVKSNPDPTLVRVLAALGASFDCASAAEIELVVNTVGVSPAQVIYANPCKAPRHIAFARDNGVDLMTFDSVDEVAKVAGIHPGARLVLRIRADAANAAVSFGSKFGAAVADAGRLIAACREHGVDFAGVSFHVGSGCREASAYDDAVTAAAAVFAEAEAAGFAPDVIDIGGGFPGFSRRDTLPDGEAPFEALAAAASAALHRHFGPSRGRKVRWIAEPGRYLCTASYTLAVQVIARRERLRTYAAANLDAELPQAQEMLYYLSDGLYGSFNNVVFDHYAPAPNLLRSTDEEPRISTVFGPTCDSVDVVMKDVQLLPRG